VSQPEGFDRKTVHVHIFSERAPPHLAPAAGGLNAEDDGCSCRRRFVAARCIVASMERRIAWRLLRISALSESKRSFCGVSAATFENSLRFSVTTQHSAKD